jgi:hypothetical protein
MAEDVQPLGQVTHYFDQIGVAVIHLWDPLPLGVWVHFYGNTTNFVQEVSSLQMDYQPVEQGEPDSSVAMKVEDRVRRGDWVYPYQPDTV